MLKKIMSIAGIAFGILFCLGTQVFATQSENYEAYVQTEMESFLSETQLPMEIENFAISIRDDIDLSNYNADEVSELIDQDISRLKDIMVSGYYDLSGTSQARLSNNGGGEYTAEVWAGVPSVGWSTVKQDFRASISSGRIRSITFLGDGYMDGVSWGQYNHIRSWYSIYANNTKVDIHIKGNINYLFNLVNANYTATFLEELEVSGNSLVRQW